MKPRRILCSLFMLLVLGRQGAALAKPLTMDQAVSLALAHSTQIQKAHQQVEAVVATRLATRGQFLPKLSVEGNIFVWDDKLAFDLMPDSSSTNIDPACIPTLSCLTPLFESFDTPVRDQVTSQITVQMVQPLSPLYAIYQGYQAAKAGEEAARSGARLARDEIVAQVQKQYIQLKQARGGVQIAQTAVRQVEVQREKAKAFAKAGVIGRNDLLKLEVAQARANGALVRARAGEAMIQSALALLVGFPPGDPIEITQTFADPPPAFKSTLEQCFERALQNRPEMRVVEAAVAMAKAGHRAAHGAMIPQIAAVGAYQHNEGQGFVQPKNVWFVGASLKWDVWSWGSDYYRLKEARAKVESSELDIKSLRDGIYLQVKGAFLELRTAQKEQAIGRMGVRQAEESYRIEKSKFDNGSATTADLIDAQAALTLAQQGYNNALYGWYLALAALEQAMGQPALQPAR